MLKNTLCNSFIGLAVFFWATGASAGLIQWNSGSGNNGHWYETVITPNGISRTSAQAAATASNGYLVTILSQEEQDFIANNVLSPNPAPLPPSGFHFQDSFWTGGVADVIDLGSLTLGVPTTYHWGNGDAFGYRDTSLGGADADGLDSSANGGVVPDPVCDQFPTVDCFLPDIDTVIASFIRISASQGNWSDHPDDGILKTLEIDNLTGDITTPLTSNQFIRGYVIEYGSLPSEIPEPTTLTLMGLALAGLGFQRRKAA